MPGRIFSILIVLWVSCPLMAQLSPTQFINISSGSGLSQLDFSWGHSWGDPNNDGLPDLFVSNHYRIQDHNPPQLYYNQGDGTFLRTTVPFYESAPDMHGSGWFDFDNDGDQDLLVETGRTKRNYFLINQGGGVFTEAAIPAGLDVPFLEGRGPLFIDQNRDGLLDVIHLAGLAISPTLPPLTMTIAQDGQFTELGEHESANLSELSSNMGFLADLDGDGQLNATVVTGGQHYWYHTGCLPLEQSGMVSVNTVIEGISADFNNDLKADLYFVRNDQVQSASGPSAATNYGVYFGIDLIVPSSVMLLNAPANGTVSLDSLAALTYQPDIGFTGLDSIKIGYCDPYENCKARILYFVVQHDTIPSSTGENVFAVIPDSFKIVSIPKLVHPYRKHFKMVFQPKSNVHGVQIRAPSDSLFFVTGIPFLFPAGAIALGAGGILPSNEQGFLLRASDTLTHGLASYVQGSERKLYIGYSPEDSLWTILCNSNSDSFTGLVSLLTSVPVERVHTINYDTVFSLLPDQLMFQTESGFVDATPGSGLEAPNAAVTAVAGDFDNDMDIDLYLSVGLGDGNRANQLWENQGDGTFVLVPNSGGAAGTLSGSAGPASTVDFNRDGFLDLFVEQGRAPGNETPGPYELFQNTPNGNHWIGFDLEGTTSNRDGYGATLYLYAGGKAQMRAADGGIHRYAQNDQIIHFGMGPNLVADSLLIVWPSGIQQKIYNLPADQYATIVEPNDTSLSCFPPYGLEQGISGSMFGFKWKPVACALGYELVWGALDSPDPSTFRTLETSVTWPESVIVPGTMYRWKVRALCEDSSFSQYSRSMVFYPFNDCPAPGSLTSALYEPDSAVLSWEPVPNARGYRLFYRTTGSPVFKSRITKRNKIVLDARFLTPGASYEWFVQANCFFSTGGDSSALQLINLPAARLSPSSIQTHPNPAGDFLHVQIQSESNTEFVWRLLDLLGSVRLQGISETDFDIDLRDLPSGLYVFSWYDNKQSSSGSSYVRIAK